jgi:hypothetical protein
MPYGMLHFGKPWPGVLASIAAGTVAPNGSKIEIPDDYESVGAVTHQLNRRAA